MNSYIFFSIGATFIATNCGPQLRLEITKGLRARGFRVDGLSKCLRTENITEKISLSSNEEIDIISDYQNKKQTLAKYLFHLAFENDIESWHITEKVYHALSAGTVPVYIGAAEELRTISPHPKAVIFVADFQYNATALADYLLYLIKNESAYEEHREWRKNFSRVSYNIGKPELITRSWHCRVCDWAARTQPVIAVHDIKCPNHTKATV